MKIGFIGLGNVGAKLANSLLRNRFDYSAPIPILTYQLYFVRVTQHIRT